MELPNQIQSLPELALKYGTINSEQFSLIQRLHTLKTKHGHPMEYDQLLLSQKFATSYQVGLLKLIQEYLIIKKRGEEFGKIAIEKGFATQVDVDKALAEQKKAFKTAKIKKLIGDILVESRVITQKQKHAILKEQTFLDAEADKILNQEKSKKQAAIEDAGIELSEYEQQFLQIRVLDQEFAASILEKGLATEIEVKEAQDIQEKAFEREQHIQVLGNIMVGLKFITEDQKNMVLKEQNRIIKDSSEKTPVLRVNISEDQMEAIIHIDEESEPPTLAEIKTALAQKGIKYGIYPDAILQCNLDIDNKEFVAAKQDFSMELIKSRRASYLFDTSKIDTVEKKKGEALAKQGVSCETYLKIDLFGNTVEQKRGEDFTFRCANGTRLSKDDTKAFAGKTGFPSLSIERKLFVHPVINVLEDADLRYGPLEAYANLNISGVLTGAYSISAGQINADEIRGARIEAIGDVRSRVGITDAVISAQGDVYARYLHNCRIETFGNVYIENEIIDSQVFCSGKIDSGKCHVVASSLYGKKGIELANVGNERTSPCTLGAGTEHHILEKARQVTQKVKNVRKPLDELTEKKEEQEYFSKKIFQKMVELKIFHDRAKNKKEKLKLEFNKKKKSVKKEKLKNIAKLINSFEKRMNVSLSSLKNLNQTRKKYKTEIERFEKKIKQIEPGIKKETRNLQIDMFAFFEWARKEQSLSQIKINNKIFPGTILSGVFSFLEIKTNLKNISASEKETADEKFLIKIQKN